MDQLRLHVPGMTCGHCESTIRAAIEPLKSVQSVAVDLSGKEVVVIGGEEPDIRAALTEAGYEALPTGGSPSGSV